MNEKTYNLGKMFAPNLDIEHVRRAGLNGPKHVVCVAWDEMYYETDAHDTKEAAMSEALGYLHGLEKELEAGIASVKQQMEKGGSDVQ